MAAPAAEVAKVQQATLHGLYDGPDSSYKLAFADQDFLLRPETRGVRLQLEMLKVDLAMREEGVERTIVVFGSARCPSPERAREQAALAKTPQEIAAAKLALANSEHYQKAYDFGRLVAKRNLELAPEERLYICTGGGPGIMEAANRGAFEQGDKSIGLNIALPFEQEPNRYITPKLCFDHHYFHIRKVQLLTRSCGLVTCKGGFGSMDELFECLTLIQTRKIKPIPIALMGKDFWSKVVDFQLFVDEGMISEEDLDLFKIVDSAQEAWEHIKAFHGLSK